MSGGGENSVDFDTVITLSSQENNKDFLTWVYRWWTTYTEKKLMLAKNFDETKKIIAEWRKMDEDLHMAVYGDDNYSK